MNNLEKRDNAIIHSSDKITIKFTCSCKNIVTKKIEIIDKTGLFCDDCLKNKKGFYKKGPSNHNKCSVCKLHPLNEGSITDDNWETCWGRNMFFCPFHRVQYPCHNKNCEADICYNFHQEENWKIDIEFWDYDNEIYN